MWQNMKYTWYIEFEDFRRKLNSAIRYVFNQINQNYRIGMMVDAHVRDSFLSLAPTPCL